MPRVVVLAAPSGSGKTTVANALVRRRPDAFGFSVSATTRRPRTGERDGTAYHFLSRDEFQRRVAAGELLEWAEYAGELYGTLKSEVERVRAGGRHVVLDIEVQGARQVRMLYPRPESVIIFLIPPSSRVLLERLEQRRTESPPELRARLAIAVREVAAARADAAAAVFDHVVVNDDLDVTVRRVFDLVAAARATEGEPRAPGIATFLADFESELEAAARQLGHSAKRST